MLPCGFAGHQLKDCRLGLLKKGFGKRVNSCVQRGPTGSPHSTSRFKLNILSQGIHDNLIDKGRIQGRSWRLTIDTGASVNITRPDIVAGQPERKPSRAYVLETASGDIIPVLKEALVERSF